MGREKRRGRKRREGIRAKGTGKEKRRERGQKGEKRKGLYEKENDNKNKIRTLEKINKNIRHFSNESKLISFRGGNPPQPKLSPGKIAIELLESPSPRTRSVSRIRAGSPEITRERLRD